MPGKILIPFRTLKAELTMKSMEPLAEIIEPVVI